MSRSMGSSKSNGEKTQPHLPLLTMAVTVLHPQGWQDSLDQFSSVTQSCPTFCDPMAAARQASLSLTNSRSLLKFMSIELVTQMLTCLSQGLRFSGLSQ